MTSRDLPARAARLLGAVALLGVGLEHLVQFSADSYSAIPTIGTLFALNFASATVVALGLIAPAGLVGRRRADPVRAVLAVAGIAIAGGSLAALLVSEDGGLFGFTEQGYRPAIVLSIVLEATTVVLLGAFVAWLFSTAPPAPGRASRRSPRPAIRP